MSILEPASSRALTAKSKAGKRSALGIGVTTLVTILVVLLLAAFSVLSLASARSDLNLSQMATKSAQDFYTADATATEWYCELDSFMETLGSSAAGYQDALVEKGYLVNRTGAGELRVSQSFSMGTSGRQLVVTVAILDDGTTSIRQWQT